MPEAHSLNETINTHASFTELFTLIKKYRPQGKSISLDYTNHEINLISLHADNAITSTLYGLDCIGHFLSGFSFSNKRHTIQIGYFLIQISNLIQALYVLRGDCEYQMFGKKG